MAKKSKVVVAMEQFTAKYESNNMLLRISGGGIAWGGTDHLSNLLFGVNGISNVIVTRRHVGIHKSDRAEWLTIVPAVKKALARFFGKGAVCVIERMRRTMPEDIAMVLGEADAESLRETFRGCALTEDECDALGIDFNQHNLELRGVDY